ncbi:hypothetical protein CFP56_010171 [Quercus suber]|uniref:Uncharacterized protein n=1 Tax=Quercus suber TaxID=58331 RepID=A0AAW0L242_QUESU
MKDVRGKASFPYKDHMMMITITVKKSRETRIHIPEDMIDRVHTILRRKTMTQGSQGTYSDSLLIETTIRTD